MSSCLSFRQDPNLKKEHLPDWRLLCSAQPEEASKRPMALSAISNSERLLMPVFRSSIYPARVNFDVIGGGGYLSRKLSDLGLIKMRLFLRCF